MKVEKIKEIVVTEHYCEDDADCCEDYCSIDIAINGKKVAEYGDSYHDNGQEKVEGFLDALNFLGCKVDPSHKYIADFKDC